jgi:hypothetical protein
MPAFTETDSLNRIFQFLVLTLFGFEGFRQQTNGHYQEGKLIYGLTIIRNSYLSAISFISYAFIYSKRIG